MTKKAKVGSGGVSAGGNIIAENVAGRDVTKAGRDVVRTDEARSSSDLNHFVQALLKAIKAAPPERQPEAAANVEQLHQEIQKGDKADDGVLARIIDSLLESAPAAVGAVFSAFGNSVLSGIAGPVTKFVLEKLSRQFGETLSGDESQPKIV